MDADAQALVQTSMAETQRRAQKDQTDAQMAQAKLVNSQQLEQAKLKADADKFMAEKQMDLAMSAEDNRTKERIESAKLTHEGGKLQHEQVKTALGLENQAQTGDTGLRLFKFGDLENPSRESSLLQQIAGTIVPGRKVDHAIFASAANDCRQFAERIQRQSHCIR